MFVRFADNPRSKFCQLFCLKTGCFDTVFSVCWCRIRFFGIEGRIGNV